MAGRDTVGTFRSLAGVFTLAFVGALLVLALLGNFGLPDTALGTALGVGVVIAFALAGIAERTMRAREFHTASGVLPATVNGIATAAAFLSATGIIGFAGATFSSLDTSVAVVLGWSLGFLLMAVLIAPYFRKSGADDVPDFLAVRYDSQAVRGVAALLVAGTMAVMLAAVMETGTAIAAQLFALPHPAAGWLVVALVVAGTFLGGMRAVTLSALAQYIVLAVAIVAPATILSIIAYGVPLPQIAAGLAWQDSHALAAGADLAAPLASRFLPLAATSAFDLVAIAVVFAAGVAALPHLILRQATLRSPPSARWSGAWSLVFVLVVALTVPAYAIYARLALLRDIVGTAIFDLPDWLFALGRKGMATLCGAPATSAAAAQAACTLSGNTGPVAAGNLAVSADAILLSWGDIVGLPYVITALILVGLLAGALAAANAMAFAVAEALGNNFYGRLIDTHVSAGRRLLITRVTVVAVAAVCAWLGAAYADAILPSSLTALSVLASGLFPVLVLATWSKRINGAGAVAGMILGSATVLVVEIGRQAPGLLPLPFGANGLTAVTAALVGIPVGFAAAILASLATRAPTPEQQALVDALRRPDGAPLVDRAAS